MIIAYITNNYEPIISGITISINSYVESLREIGHEVYVIAPNYPKYYDIKSYVFRTHSLAVYYKEKYPISVATSFSIKKLLRNLSIELVHSHHPFGLGETTLRAVRSTLRLPIVFTYHTNYEDYSHYVPLPNLQYLKKYISTRAIAYANSSDLVICPSEFIKEKLSLSGCIARMKVLPSPISRHLCNDISDNDCLEKQKKLNIPQGKFIFLCVTRLAPEKNTDFLLRAYALFVKNNDNSTLIIAGDGPLKDYLKVLAFRLNISEYVVFAGMESHFNLSLLYSLSNALLFCSKTETQGMPLAESLFFSLPVVAVESPAANEFIKKYECGITTENNEKAFAFGMAKIFTNGSAERRTKMNANKLTLKYNEKVLADRLGRLYVNTINSFDALR